MKKLIVVLVIMAITLLALSIFAPAHAQAPGNEEKPTFYRLTPGVYVNGWPRFTIHYLKDWVERLGNFAAWEVFRVGPPSPAKTPVLSVIVGPVPYPLDKFADIMVQVFKATGATEVTVVSDKPSHLRDGTPAQEVEFQMVVNGAPTNVVDLAMKKADCLVFVNLRNSPKIGEDLKAIIYSLEFQPGKDKPVKVPPDIQEFLDRHCNDLISHDLAKFMTLYSDRYLNSGVRKGEMERFWRQYIGLVTSAEMGITEFVPAGDRVYLAGFGATNLGKSMAIGTTIIKENGEWKWYGNQRDVSP